MVILIEYNHLRTPTPFWSQLHTSQVSCLHLQRFLRYRANEILLTQQNKQTHKQQPKNSQLVHTTKCGFKNHFFVCWQTRTQTDG